MMMSRVENPAAAFQGLESTSTGQNHALNLEGSPSWSSATNQMQMQEYDHFYPVQQERLHGRLPHQESSHQHHPSHSSIEHPSQATHYSQELRRQQLQQLQQQRIAQARRRSGEAEFLHNFGTTYHRHQQQGPYFPLTEETSHLHPYQTHHAAHDPNNTALPSPPLLDPSAYTQTRHPLHPMGQPLQHYQGEEGNHQLHLHTPPLQLE
jgi:hypothetical protein